MTIKRRLFDAASDLIISLLRLNRPYRIYRAFSSRINAVKKMDVHGTPIVFDANEELHLLRADSIEHKEPETLQWIDSFTPGAVFFDIGANVGVFSLYAALCRNCDVYAFEPEAKNYACLNKNILLNGLGRRVKALNIGLHDQTCIEFLQLHDTQSGSALHALGDPVDWRKERFQAKFEQAVLAFSLDDLIDRYGLPLPRHIKLDVDGNEQKIIRGAQRTLGKAAVKSLLIEINVNDRPLIAMIESCGLKLTTLTPAFEAIHNAVFTRQ